MNKKLIAIKVSRHPWIKRLSEVVDSKTIARLIVEEIKNKDQIEAILDSFVDQFENLDRILTQASFDPKGAKENFEKAFDALENDYLEYSGKGEHELPKKALEDILKSIEQYREEYYKTFEDEEETQQGGEEQTQDKEPKEPDEGLVAQFSKQVDKLNLKDEQKEALKKLLAFIYDEKTALQESIDEKVIKLLSRFKDHDEPASKIFDDISREKEVMKLINTFVAAVKEEQEAPKEQNKVQQVVSQAAKDAEEDLGDNPTKQQVQQATTQAVETIAPSAPPEVQAKIAQAAAKKVIDATGVKDSADIKALEIDEDDKKTFIAAADALQNEFYKKGYKRDQAILVNNLITIMDKIDQQDPDLELSYQRVPETQAESLNEIEYVADFDFTEEEMKELRISFRSFLSLVNKTRKALKAFEEKADKGSIMTSSLKEKFMKLLKRLQNSIALLIKAIRKKAGVSESLNEATKEELIEKWKIVQKAYNKTVEASSAFKEILSGDKPEEVDPEVLLQQAYSSAIELSQYFPSVNPFGKTTGKKAELKRYSDQFTSAIQSVKQDLQYVVNVSKRGEGNKAALTDSIASLEDFSVEIKNIFGVEGPVSGDINPREKAAQGKTTQPTAPNPKTRVKLPSFNVEDISAQLKKELEGELDDDEIGIVAKATVDMGQQSPDLPVEEFADKVVSNPQVRNVVTGDTEEAKVSSAVKTVVDQEDDEETMTSFSLPVTSQNLEDDGVEEADKFVFVFNQSDYYLNLDNDKVTTAAIAGDDYVFRTLRSDVKIPRIRIKDFISTLDKDQPYKVGNKTLTQEGPWELLDIEISDQVETAVDNAEEQGKDTDNPEVQDNIVDTVTDAVADESGQDKTKVKPVVKSTVQDQTQGTDETTPEEDKLVPLTFDNLQQRANYIDTEINKIFKGRQPDTINKARSIVFKFMKNIDSQNLDEGIEDEIDESYREAFTKAVEEAGGGVILRMLDQNEDLKKKFVRFLKQLTLGVEKNQPQKASKQQQPKSKTLHDQYKEDVQEYSDKEYLIYLRKLIYYVEESASLLTKYDMFAFKPIDEMKRVLKALNDQSEEDIFKNRNQYKGHISILDKASTAEGQLATLAIFEGKNDADKTRAKKIQDAIHKTLYTEINNYYKQKNANLKLIEVTPYKTKSDFAMSHSMEISDPRYIEGDEKYNETVALLDKVIIKDAVGRNMMRDRVDMAFAVANTGYSSGARVYGEKN